MPDQFGFDTLPRFGVVTLHCSNCDYRTNPWSLDSDARAEHAATHAVAVTVEHIDAEGNVVADSGYRIAAGMRVQACRSCGEEFAKPVRRGRPQLECDSCKGKE